MNCRLTCDDAIRNSLVSNGAVLQKTKPQSRTPKHRNPQAQRHSSIELPLSSHQSIKVPKHISGAVHAKSVEQRLKELTLEVENDLNKVAPQEDYFGNCAKCGSAVYGALKACQAMGKIYHNDCFTCCCCSRTLRGKAFFNVNGKIYCDEDYKYSGFQKSASKCFLCGHPIMEMILQALGKCYHPGCFRCNICNKSLDGIPFTIGSNNKIYCVEDYSKIQEALVPTCAKCCLPIMAEDGRKETMKVVAMNKDFHLSCFVCDNCGIKLTDKSQPTYFMNKTSVMCDRCHAAKVQYGQQQCYAQPTKGFHPPPNQLPTHAIRHRSWEISSRPQHHYHQENRVKSWNQ